MFSVQQITALLHHTEVQHTLWTLKAILYNMFYVTKTRAAELSSGCKVTSNGSLYDEKCLRF